MFKTETVIDEAVKKYLQHERRMDRIWRIAIIIVLVINMILLGTVSYYFYKWEKNQELYQQSLEEWRKIP